MTLPAPETRERPWRLQPPSARQLDYLRALVTQRQCDALGPIPSGATMGKISDAIEWCKRQPRRDTPPPAPQHAPVHVTDGIYSYADTLVRIKRAVYNGGYQYAQTWNPTAESWDTVRGLLRAIKLDILTGHHNLEPLSAAAASAFGRLYGRCVNCMHVLTDDNSIAHGYGPVCAETNGWDY